MTRRLQAVVIAMLAGLSACTTTKEEAPAQIAAVPSQQQPSSHSPSRALPSEQPLFMDPYIQPFTQSVPDHVYFEYDRADLDPVAIAVLQKQSAWLQRFPTVVLVIEGHGDERGTREYNLALGARRADAVRAYLMTRGITAARLDTVSYGKERPACAGSDEACWKLSRRAVSLVNIDATNGRN